MKNEHLIPPIVRDIGDKILSPTTREHEKAPYIQRLEAVREYAEYVLQKVKKYA